MGIAAPIQADYGKVQAIVGTEDATVTLGRGSQGKSRRSYRKCIEKFTSCHHRFFLYSSLLAGADPRSILFDSDLFGHNVRCAIGAAQQAIGFLVADDLLLGGIEFQGAAKTVRGVREVHECRGDMSFLDGRVNVLSATAADAIDEIGVVVGGAFASGAGFDLIGDPSFVGVVSIDGEIAV